MPRDIESQVGELDAAICIQLMTYVSENIAAREQAAEQAQTIIRSRTDEFAGGCVH